MVIIRYLFISDLHISSKKSKIRDSTLNIPIQFVLLYYAIEEVLEKEQPDYVIIAGDLIDKQTSVPVFDVSFLVDFIIHIRDLMNQYGAKGNILVLRGNHDTVSYQSIYSSAVSILRGINGVEVIQDPYIMMNNLDRTILAFLPYEKSPQQHAINKKLIFDRFHEDRLLDGHKRAKILISHNDLDIFYTSMGIEIEEEIGDDEDKKEQKFLKYENFKEFYELFDISLFGHIHSYVNPVENIYTITSFHPSYSFGEGMYLRDLALKFRILGEDVFKDRQELLGRIKQRLELKQHLYVVIDTDKGKIKNFEHKESPHAPIFITVYENELLNEKYFRLVTAPILQHFKENNLDKKLFVKIKIQNPEKKNMLILKAKEVFSNVLYLTFEVDTKNTLMNKEVIKEISTKMESAYETFKNLDGIIEFIKKEGLNKVDKSFRNFYSRQLDEWFEMFEKELSEGLESNLA